MKRCLLSVSIGLLVGFGWAAEPEYQGKPLSQWLSQLHLGSAIHDNLDIGRPTTTLCGVATFGRFGEGMFL